ncbi:hypothetical protein GGS26DRAFT_185572 [Hypomontagnella submonticulosa]|nr:hypothetical protein GGS26DRAFT_185572 [Hypomontagnella submonticulosa]
MYLLEDYIRRVAPDVKIPYTSNSTSTNSDEHTTAANTGSSTAGSSSSNTYTSRPPSTLHKDRKSYILLYNGCFNPPHVGHLAHLSHAFHHGGPDLYFAGAIILIAGDFYLGWKLGSPSSALQLSESQRRSLWEAELAQRPDEGRWCFVLREDTWPRVVETLEQFFKVDGLEVEFVRVAGGDKAGRAKVQHGVWGCRMTLTTDVSRPVDFYAGEAGETGAVRSPPSTLRAHGPWRRIQEAKDDGVESGEAGKEAGPRTEVGRVSGKRDIWQCESMFIYSLRFVTSHASERLDPDLSSTKIRNIIAATLADSKKPLDTLEDELRGVALSPGLLTQYVWEASGRGWE